MKTSGWAREKSRALLLGLIIAIAPCVSNASPVPVEINLVSEAWDDATNKDGSGLYWDIMRLVYEPIGIKVNIETTTYSRSVYLVKTEKSDAWLGSYIDEEEAVLYPYWHFDADAVSALYKKKDDFQWAGEDSLVGKTVGWVKGYDYDEYIDLELNKKELQSRKQAIQLVFSGRLDFLIDAKSDLEDELQKDYIKSELVEIRPLMDLKLYPAFANNEKGLQLREIYDKRLEELLESGEIKRLYENWDWETYPYNN